MPSAICTHCQEPAFSSIEFVRPWKCPTCGKIVIPPRFEDERKRGVFARDSAVEQYTRYWLPQ